MSDVHSPICLEINLPYNVVNTALACDLKYEKILFTSKWKHELKEQYHSTFDATELANISAQISPLDMSSNPSALQINQLVADLTTAILKPAKSLGMCRKIGKQNSRPLKSPRQAWFDTNCEQQRKIFFKAKNSLRKAKTETEREIC